MVRRIGVDLTIDGSASLMRMDMKNFQKTYLRARNLLEVKAQANCGQELKFAEAVIEKN